MVLPDQDVAQSDDFSIENLKNHPAWPSYLEKAFGDRAAASFAVGSDLLRDKLSEDLRELANYPKGTHLGQLDFSFLSSDLPQHFMMDYDYDYLYHMKCCLLEMISRAKNGHSMVAHSVIEELILLLCNDEAKSFFEIEDVEFSEHDNDDEYIASKDWVFDLFDDADIEMFLFSDYYLQEGDTYHFSRWFEPQFNLD